MTMSPSQREALQLLGYTRKESEFLYVVATHSGYFTVRQFKSFIQTESGSVCHAFVRKLLERHHATYQTFRSGGRVYHVFARRLYQAMGRENLRTRKKHELDYVKTRLVALDFVLGDPERHYLETEPEKMAFFERNCRLQRECFPVRQYRAKKSADVTSRYFVDRFPMFVDGPPPGTVTFTYIDAGAMSLQAFGTHLRAYLGFFRALPKFAFAYLSTTDRLFAAAESEFHHVLYGQRFEKEGLTPLEYFRLRKAWDQKQRVASAQVVLLKEAQARYTAPQFEQLYETWSRGGVPDEDVARTVGDVRPARNALFGTFICGSSLRIFREGQTSTAEDCTESHVHGGLSQLSEMPGSPEI
jgi:hypothetical protein